MVSEEHQSYLCDHPYASNVSDHMCFSLPLPYSSITCLNVANKYTFALHTSCTTLLFNDDSHHSLFLFIRFFTFSSHSHESIISKAPDISNDVKGLISNVVPYCCLFVEKYTQQTHYIETNSALRTSASKLHP